MSPWSWLGISLMALSTAQRRALFFSVLKFDLQPSLQAAGLKPSVRNMEATPNAQINPQPNSSQSDTFDNYPAPDQPRVRSKSDTSSRPPTWGFTPSNPLSSTNRTNANPSDNRRHSRSKGELVHPPAPRTDSANDPKTGGDQSLHPTQTVLHLNPGQDKRSSGRGLVDRGIGGLPDVPFPSPDGSPSLGCEPLPSIPSLHNFSVSSSTGRSRPTSTVINRPDTVTTTTVETSERRRIVHKSFACPVPGCGKTFGRDVSLRSTSHRPLRKKLR